MHLQELQDALHYRPFVPFRLYVSDGAVYEIRHPELCVPGRRAVFIGLTDPAEAEPVFDRHALVDLVHVTRIEQPIDKAAKAG